MIHKYENVGFTENIRHVDKHDLHMKVLLIMNFEILNNNMIHTSVEPQTSKHRNDNK